MNHIRLADRDPRYVDISCLVRDWSSVQKTCESHELIEVYRLSTREKKLEVHLGIFVETCRLLHVDSKEVFPILYEEAKERLRNLRSHLLVNEDNMRLLGRRIAAINRIIEDSSSKELLEIERKLSRIQLRAMLRFAEAVRESQHSQRISSR